MENRVAIVVITYNTSELIAKHIECIKRFCKDDHEIIIIDNSNKAEVIEPIRYHAETNGCVYYKTNASTGDSSQSHAFAANFAYNKFQDSYTKFLFLDHDNFPVKEFSVNEMLSSKALGGLGQGKLKGYFWPGCFMFDNEKVDHSIIDFSPNSEFRLDTGGNLYKLIERYGVDQCVFFDEEYHQNPYFNKSQYNFYSMINKGMFLHFTNASNWNGAEHHEERINSLMNVLNDKLCE